MEIEEDLGFLSYVPSKVEDIGCKWIFIDQFCFKMI